MSLMDVVEEAGILVRRGLAVFPLPAGSKIPDPGWQEKITIDEAALPELLAGRNVGVSCRASHITVLDLDNGPEENGLVSFDKLVRRLGESWPVTLVVATPGGGMHLYFRSPPGATNGSISGGRTELGPGIDVRGPGRRSGGYVVGPGSVVGGSPYILTHNTPLADLPPWIALRLGRRTVKSVRDRT